MRAALFLSAALIASPALAQNTQLQLRGVSAETSLEVDETQDAGATAIASGNVVTATNEDQDATLTNDQDMRGDARAETSATIWDATGAVVLTSAAIGNGATAISRNGDLTLHSDQRASGDAEAQTNFVSGAVGDASTSANASGNVAAVDSENGAVYVEAAQSMSGNVRAETQSDLCCVAGQATSGAIASANNLSLAGSTTTMVSDTTQTSRGDRVEAHTDLYAGYATDASANATANANALNITNEWGYLNAHARQDSSTDVSAQSYVTLGGDFLGFGSAGAYGVGNSAVVSNIGSDTAVDIEQNNSGAITADAAFAGEGGQMALASSAAYGNNVSVALCTTCETDAPSLDAANQQHNSGDVRATSRVVTARSAYVGATSTAIGNAATFQSTSPGP